MLEIEDGVTIRLLIKHINIYKSKLTEFIIQHQKVLILYQILEILQVAQ